MPLSACFEGAEEPDRDAFPDSSPIARRDFRLIETIAVKLADAAKREDEAVTSALLVELLRLCTPPSKAGA